VCFWQMLKIEVCLLNNINLMRFLRRLSFWSLRAFLVIRDHGVYMHAVYIWKWSSAQFRSCAGGVNGVSSFIAIDEQLQQNRGCYILVQAMLPEGYPFFCPVDKRMTSPHVEWCIAKCPGLCTIFFKTSKWYLRFMFYHAVIKIRGFKLPFFSYKTKK